MRTGPTSILFFVFGLLELAVYYLTEPAAADPAQPFTVLAHGFWESFAIRGFWPFAGMTVLGGVGIIRSMVRSVLRD